MGVGGGVLSFKNGTLKCDEHETKGDPEVKREVQDRHSVQDCDSHSEDYRCGR